MKFLLSSRYHIIIISLYILLYLYFFFFTATPLKLFVFKVQDLFLLVPVVVAAVAVLFVANRYVRFGTIGVNKNPIAKLPFIVVYASILIAVPEEILFRGLLQTYLHSVIPNAPAAILFSSLLFGFAHSLNGAQQYGPAGWNWKLIGMTFVAGIFLGFSFYITGSLVSPILLHTIVILIMKVFIKEDGYYQGNTK